MQIGPPKIGRDSGDGFRSLSSNLGLQLLRQARQLGGRRYRDLARIKAGDEFRRTMIKDGCGPLNRDPRNRFVSLFVPE